MPAVAPPFVHRSHSGQGCQEGELCSCRIKILTLIYRRDMKVEIILYLYFETDMTTDLRRKTEEHQNENRNNITEMKRYGQI